MRLPDDSKLYKGLEAVIENKKIENIESDLKIWENKCFETIKSISEELIKKGHE